MIIILTILIYFIIKNNYYELYTNDVDVKYPLKDLDKNYFEKHGKILNRVPKNANGFFYTNNAWNPSNYLTFNDKYYMVEPGYYYRVSPEIVYFTDKINILFVEKKIKDKLKKDV